MREVLLSVGIDIGTSTTQLVFSHITIENVSSNFSVPRVEIVDKEIVFRSEIFFTPLKSPAKIDMDAVKALVAQQYELFCVKKEDVKTGAVLITGETARKENASEVVLKLSEFAGDFVVATAGPDLESVIAGRGAGADEYSKKHLCAAANYDIGGGTSNFVLFKNGEPLITGCMDIGGRLVRVDAAARKITYIAPKISALLASRGLALYVGDKPETAALKKVCEAMVEVLEMSLGLREKDEMYQSMLTLENKDISLNTSVQSISFSGGVADYIYGGDEEADIFKYGDIGILLGRAIKSSQRLSQIPLAHADETIRATVVGAGSHVTEISGSTIDYNKELLPLKNLPVVKLLRSEENDEATMAQSIEEKLTWHCNNGAQQAAAIAFCGERSPGFAQLQSYASGIVKGAKALVKAGHPIIVIVENDMAKALGQALRSVLPAGAKVICIDAVRAANGDYVDIGQPVAGGTVLPVVVKTLVFN